MLATTPTNRFLGKPLAEEDVQTSEFICEVGNVIASIEEGLDWSMSQLYEPFDIVENDYIREASAKQKLLVQACSFLLQRPVADREVVSANLLTFEAVNTFFYDFKSNPPANNSPQGESPVIKAAPVVTPELEALRRENERLQLEVQQLRREKELAEESAISAMRRRPTRHHRRSYDSLDAVFSALVKDAVADALQEAGEGKANV